MVCELDHKEGCQRIDAFKISYWKRLLKVPWTARRSNQSILREMNPEYTLEYYFQQFIGKTDAEAEVPVFWSSDVNSQLIGKVPDTRKD